MANLYMDLKPLGKKYFIASIHDNENNYLKLFSDGEEYILPDPDVQADEDYVTEFWYRVMRVLSMRKLKKFGRRLTRKGKELRNIPLMRSCAR